MADIALEYFAATGSLVVTTVVTGVATIFQAAPEWLAGNPKFLNCQVPRQRPAGRLYHNHDNGPQQDLRCGIAHQRLLLKFDHYGFNGPTHAYVNF